MAAVPSGPVAPLVEIASGARFTSVPNDNKYGGSEHDGSIEAYLGSDYLQSFLVGRL